MHRPTVPGISGTKAEGADSIVVNGGYVDDVDHGEEIIYTGAGGNDPGSKRQVADQSLEYTNNAGLVTSQLEGLPVRVIRGPSGDPAYSPKTGYRYDGLYRVAEHWADTGADGFLIWRFRLERLTGQEQVPYVPLSNLPAGSTQPKTFKGITTRVVRSTAVSQAIKRLYDGACQVCHVQLPVPGGSVAEGAHIRALGRPHSGPDVPENVLCLCPNHHSLFDQGGIYVTDTFEVRDYLGKPVGPLARDPEHEIEVAHLRAHRERFGFSSS